MAVLANLLEHGIDPSKDEIWFDFEDDAGHRHHIPLKGGVGAGLLISLLDLLRQRSLAHSGRQFEEQPLQLDNASAVSFENHKVGLILQLESNLRFPFVLNSGGLARLQSALSSCGDLMKPSGSHRAH
jgi:hypothetical protein